MPVKASFVCPTYNLAGYLAETIESVRYQTVPDWELIVVDDASTDTTPQLMDYYQKEDSRIRYVRLPENQGTVGARNAGNKVAKAPLILVIDHDDLCTKNRLAVTLSHFERNPDTDIFHAGWYECNIYGASVEQWHPMKLTKKSLSKNVLFCHSTAAYPKRIADKYPYIELERDGLSYTDDLAALDSWLNAGLKFRTSKKPLVGVRRLPQGQMQKIRASKGLPPSWRQ